MDLTFTRDDLDDFIINCNFLEIIKNDGGMKLPDMFSFYFLLKKLQPKVVIESGVWNGLSTKLIRNTLGPNVTIICLDPREIDIQNGGFVDSSHNTKYFVGDNFIDFKDFDLQNYDRESTLCFFDDHQNAVQRLIQCKNKNIKHLFFNDNYPVNCGSHFTLQHLLLNDPRDKFDLHNQYKYSINTFPQIDLSKKNEYIGYIDTYHIFPNIFPSKIDTWEGIFDCKSLFDNYYNDDEQYLIFKKYASNYCWNTYVTIK
jgi:hypothetical protein